MLKALTLLLLLPAATAAAATSASTSSGIKLLARLSIFLQSMECCGPPGGASGLADGALARRSRGLQGEFWVYKGLSCSELFKLM